VSFTQFRVAVGFKFPVEKSASLKLEDMKISPEDVEKQNVPGKDGKLPRANDLYFSILRCCHMGMVNSILAQFGVKSNEELKAADKDKFVEALKHGYKFFERPMAGSGYLVRTKDVPTTDSSPARGDPDAPSKAEKVDQSGQVIATKPQLDYFDVTPILFEDYSGDPNVIVEEATDFDEALRTYFENVKIDRGEETNYQNQVWKKFENIREDQESRLKQIKESIDDNYIKAQLIENNINEIQAIIDVNEA
jgi:predicted ribosome quality control (RQC) complex YloA/Tae2 family protein